MKIKLIVLIFVIFFINLNLNCSTNEEKLEEIRKLNEAYFNELYTGNYLKAMDVVNELLKISSNNCIYLSQKGKLKYYLGYYESAVKLLNEAVEKCADNYLVYYERALVLEQLEGNYRFIIEDDFDKSIELSNGKYAPLMSAVTYYHEKGYYGKAIRLLQRMIELHSEDFIILYRLGICYQNINKYEEALECFNKSEQLDSSNFYSIEAKANFHFSYEEYEISLNTYLKALKLMPKFYKKYDRENYQALFINRIAYNYYKLGKYKEANKYNIKAMNYKTKDPVIVKDRALILLKLKQKEKALLYYFKSSDLGYRSYLNSENDDIELLLRLKKQYAFYNDLDRYLYNFSKLIRFFL